MEILKLWNSVLPFHGFQPFADDTDFGMGQFRAVDLGLDGSRAGQHTRWSSQALLQLSQASSIVLPSQGVGGPFSQVLQTVRGWASSPALKPSRLAHLYLYHQSQLHCVAQAMQCAVPALLNAIASERAALGLPLS